MLSPIPCSLFVLMSPNVDLACLATTTPEHWQGWFLRIHCACKGGRRTSIRSLRDDRRIGPLNMGQVVERLTCSRCKTKPTRIELVSNHDMVGLGQPDPAVIVLLPPDQAGPLSAG